MEMLHTQISEMAAQIRKAERRRHNTDQQEAAERRRPENAHYRALWDAKQRAAEIGDMDAYSRIDKMMKLYRTRPETAVAAQPSVTSPGSSVPQE
jgi:hypothetical protein